MPSKTAAQSSYSVLLLQKLLSLRDSISPLTLVLDSHAAPARPLLDEIVLRARAAGVRVVYAAALVAPSRPAPLADVLVERRGRPLAAFRDDIRAQCKGQKSLVVVDTLCQIALHDPLTVAAFAASLVSPTASVVGLYHTDGVAAAAAADDAPMPPVYVPGSPAPAAFGSPAATRLLGPEDTAAGKPPPLRVLCHLATAVLRVQSLFQEAARKRARDRSEEAPQFGPWGRVLVAGRHPSPLAAGTGPGTAAPEGTPLDSPADALYRDSLLLTMELRRRSGRSVVERYVLGFGQKQQQQQQQQKPAGEGRRCSDICVLADHPLFAAPSDPGHRADDDDAAAATTNNDSSQPASTFDLGLTDKQRLDRAGIELPYFDAQTDIGAGEGGRILYDMGREDDFDDEEDEI